MVALTEHTSTGINALSVGVTPGPTANQTQNAAILNQYASDGFSIYFPPGDYYVNAPILYSGAAEIKLWGDAAVLTQTTDQARLFDIRNCDNVEVCGLTMRTAYYAARASAGGATESSPIYMDLCKAVRIHHNLIEGFQCHGIRVGGGQLITITDNQFRDGHWLVGGSNQQKDTCCINMWLGSDNSRARDVIISRNNCVTRTVVPILSQPAMRKVVCSDNVVISADENGVPDEAYNVNAVKTCIELQYFAENNYNPADDEDYDGFTITGNTCQGARFAGIGGQSSTRPNAVHAGIRGVVTGNTIRHCGTTNNAAETSNLQGGIVWVGYRDLIISDNTINNIPSNGGGANGTSAIVVQGIWGRHDGATDSGTPNSCVIADNIISNCQSRGIYVVAQNPPTAAGNGSGDININNNVIQDIDSQVFLRVVVPTGTYRAGHVRVNNNTFASTKTVGTYVARIEMGSAGAGECQVNGNTFNFADANFTAQRAIVDIVSQEAMIVGNRIKGDGAAGNAVGIDLRSTVTGERFTRTLIADNQIDECKIGIGSSSGASYGPFLLSNCSLSNCGTNIEFPRSVKHGSWENGKAIMYEDVDPTSAPQAPQGTYLAGDIIFNTNMTQTGDPLGWCYAGSGNWLPLVAVP